MRQLIREWRAESGEEFCDYRLELVVGGDDEELLDEGEFCLEVSWRVKGEPDFQNEGGDVLPCAAIGPLIEVLTGVRSE